MMPFARCCRSGSDQSFDFSRQSASWRCRWIAAGLPSFRGARGGLVKACGCSNLFKYPLRFSTGANPGSLPPLITLLRAPHTSRALHIHTSRPDVALQLLDKIGPDSAYTTICPFIVQIQACTGIVERYPQRGQKSQDGDFQHRCCLSKRKRCRIYILQEERQPRAQVDHH